MQEINTEIYLKKKQIRREKMEEIDIVICLKKKSKKWKEFQKKYCEANKSRKTAESWNLIKKFITKFITYF